MNNERLGGSKGKARQAPRRKFEEEWESGKAQQDTDLALMEWPQVESDAIS